MDNAIRDVLDNLSPETIDIIVSYRFREILCWFEKTKSGYDRKRALLARLEEFRVRIT